MGDYTQVCCGVPGVRSAKAEAVYVCACMCMWVCVCMCVCILHSVRVFSHLSPLPPDV